jgi:hypothetical protein
MGISKTELNGQLDSARANGWDLICAGAEEEKGLSKGLLLAIASRETNMADVVGDSGHGRGLFQIDDRFWREWLTARGVAGRGKKPLIGDAARLAAAIVSDNLAFGRKNGVAAGDLLKFAASAYNAGPGGAIRGYREGDRICTRRATITGTTCSNASKGSEAGTAVATASVPGPRGTGSSASARAAAGSRS